MWYRRTVAILCAFLWVPQIIHNARTSNKKLPNIPYLLATTFNGLLIGFYINCYPFNYLDFQPSISTLFLIIMILFLQFAVLYLQFVKGPKFFIPRFLWHEYNYIRKIKKSTSNDETCIDLKLDNEVIYYLVMSYLLKQYICK